MGRVRNDPSLSYRVYTADEIPRAPRARPAPPPSPWPPVRRAIRDLALAAKEWAVEGGPRPPLRLALRAPFDDVVRVLRPALATVDWKRLGIGVAVGIGTLVTLLFVVLAIADLADGSAAPRSTRASGALAEPAEVLVDPEPVPAPLLDDDLPEAPPPDPPPKPTPKPVEVFIP